MKCFEFVSKNISLFILRSELENEYDTFSMSSETFMDKKLQLMIQGIQWKSIQHTSI